jgi:hypothetical protein
METRGSHLAIVAINIDPALYERIAMRVREGGYVDLAQFFDLAARNQLALEGTPSPLMEMRRPRGGDGSAEQGERRPPTAGAQTADSVAQPGGWRALVRRHGFPSDRFPQSDVDTDLSHLLWGQTNRLLPVAVGVRVLANLLGNSDDVPLATWHENAIAVATALRDDLRVWDERASHPHGTRWATAFPEPKESSAQRYISQFLGASARNGSSDGGAVFLGLAAISGSGENARATLTSSGAQWASFRNPIFDADPDVEPERTFSEEEARFFLEHLREFRIGEYRFLSSVAELVAQGKSREDLNEAIERAYPAWASVASTMRAGAIGRLGDLGLLERSRHGLHVAYRLSPLATRLGLPDETSEVVG